jgi:hypothetical protein
MAAKSNNWRISLRPIVIFSRLPSEARGCHYKKQVEVEAPSAENGDALVPHKRFQCRMMRRCGPVAQPVRAADS